MFWILVSLSFPIFYIVGLVVFIRWIVNSSRARPVPGAADAVDKIRAYAAKQPPETARDLNDLADELLGIKPRHILPGPVSHEPSLEPERFEPGQPAHKTRSVAHAAPVTVKPEPVQWTSLTVSDLSRNLDNINLLLYLGAFLIVVSAGIFVGYNFSVLSGVFKTIFLALFAGAFYSVGLLLFLKARKLRPAGTTFTGIGLVLMPLVGLAAYNFTSLHGHGAATWFITSIFTLAAYIATLAVTRQSYIAYLMAFTTLSTFESSVSLFNLPVYWFGWVMATTSIILFSLSGTKLIQLDETRAALTISAHIFVPASLLLSAYAVEPHGSGQLGVTIGLAGAFYAALAARFIGKPQADAYWFLAIASLPTALGIGLWHSLSRTGIAIVMLVVAALYLAAEHLFTTQLSRRWRELMALVTGLLPLAGLTVVYDRPGMVAAILIGATVINGELALRLRQSSLGLLATLSLIAAPFVLLRGYLDPAWPWSSVSAALIIEAPLLVWWSRRMHGWPDSGTAAGVGSYLLALLLALITAGLSSSTALMVAAAVIAGILYGLSIFEHRAEFVYGAAASLYIALMQLSVINNWRTTTDAITLLLAGAALYALGTVEADSGRARALRYSGLAGPYLGALIGVGEDRIEPVLALTTGGLLLFAEGQRATEPLVQEFAGSVLVVAFNWLLSVANVGQTQAYTVPWAAFVGYLGYRRRERGHDVYDIFTVVALGILTIPLAGQALGENGQGYGLLLILEGLALVFLGMAASYRLITLWGTTTLVLEVLYQLRDFFYALPKYVISAGLGLALLVVAIVMLQRRKSDD